MSTAKSTYRRRWTVLLAVAAALKQNQERRTAGKKVALALRLNGGGTAIRKIQAEGRIHSVETGIFGYFWLHKTAKGFHKFQRLYEKEGLWMYPVAKDWENTWALIQKFFGIRPAEYFRMNQMTCAVELEELTKSIGRKHGYIRAVGAPTGLDWSRFNEPPEALMDQPGCQD